MNETKLVFTTVSVAVVCMSGVQHLTRCIESLRRQHGAPEFEIVVACAPQVPGIEAARQRFPEARIVINDGQRTPLELASRAVRECRGELILLTKDHCVPSPDWVRAMVDAQRKGTDARVVAATNKELGAAIAAGEFREDLYFRLNVITIELPALRDRSGDLEPLAQHFLAEFVTELGRPRSGFSAAALARIRGHAWPGNVRELRNVIERAVLMGDGPAIELADLSIAPAFGGSGRGGWRPLLPPGGLPLEDVERAVVVEALERCGWVQKEAAAWLRVSRRKLNYMIQQMGITHATWRRNRDTD